MERILERESNLLERYLKYVSLMLHTVFNGTDSLQVLFDLDKIPRNI